MVGGVYHQLGASIHERSSSCDSFAMYRNVAKTCICRKGSVDLAISVGSPRKMVGMSSDAPQRACLAMRLINKI